MSRGVALALALLLPLAGCTGGPAERPESTRAETAAAYNLQLGVAYLKQDKLALAREKLDRAVKQNPRDPQIHNARALLAEKLNEPEDADRAYRAALRIAPDEPDISNNYAVFLCRTGRIDEGVKRFVSVARNKLYRAPEAAWTNAGVCLRTARRPEEAAEHFARALAVRPNHAEAMYQLADLDLERGMLVEARSGLDRFLDTYRPTPELLLLGVRIARAQNDRMAEERYARRLRIEFPDSDQLRELPARRRNPG
ncbi:MAG: type IV pilus biogenesis/stability protein PilW [Steroidobacteraceae bacterium]